MGKLIYIIKEWLNNKSGNGFYFDKVIYIILKKRE